MSDRHKARRIAIVTYFFPPLGGVGVQRVLKYATYLPRSGWRPSVFTPRDPAYEIADPGLGGAVAQDLEVHRSFILEPLSVYRRFAGLRHGSIKSGSADIAPAPRSTVSDRGAAAPTVRTMRTAGWPARAMRKVARLMFIPDEQMLWVPFGIRSLRSVHRASGFDAVLSSSPPVTTHLIAGLGRRPGTPWVADFRDPWIGGAFEPRVPRPHRALRKWIERWIVSHANLTTFATPRLREQYATRYPELAERFVTLTNGYDRNDLPTPLTHDSCVAYRLVYAGSLNSEHELEVFLDGLRRALSRRPELRGTLRIEFIGWLNRRNRALADEALHDPALSEVLAFMGFRPQEEALRHVAAADAGLLVLSDEPGKEVILPVKMFDYIGLDRQIFAALPTGDARDILRELDWGIVVRPDAESIAAGLERLVDSRKPARQADPEGRYDRVAITARLGALLDVLADRAGTTA